MRAYETTREAQSLGGWCQKRLAAVIQMPARIHGIDDGDGECRAKNMKSPCRIPSSSICAVENAATAKHVRF
jgi:hypothetical protein